MLIWNVRTRPRFTRASGFSAVMSSAPSRMWPASGRSMPVIRLIKRRLAGAVRPDQRMARALRQVERDVARDDERAEALVESTRGESGRAHGRLRSRRKPRQSAEDAVRQEDHDGDQQEADPEEPVLRIDAGELVARHHVDDRADDPAIEPAGAAENQDHQHVRRALEAQRFERNRLRGLRQQRAGDAGHHGRDGVDLADVGVAWRADRRHARRVLADAAQRQSERRMDQPPRHHEQQEQDHQRIGVGGRAPQIERELAEEAATSARPAARRRRRSASSRCSPPRRGEGRGRA